MRNLFIRLVLDVRTIIILYTFNLFMFIPFVFVQHSKQRSILKHSKFKCLIDFRCTWSVYNLQYSHILQVIIYYLIFFLSMFLRVSIFSSSVGVLQWLLNILHCPNSILNFWPQNDNEEKAEKRFNVQLERINLKKIPPESKLNVVIILSPSTMYVRTLQRAVNFLLLEKEKSVGSGNSNRCIVTLSLLNISVESFFQ